MTAAIYDAADDTVTLTLRNRLNVHLRDELTVNGTTPTGVSSPDGVLLDGADTGRPGSNFQAIFGREILAGPARAINRAAQLRQAAALRASAAGHAAALHRPFLAAAPAGGTPGRERGAAPGPVVPWRLPRASDTIRTCGATAGADRACGAPRPSTDGNSRIGKLVELTYDPFESSYSIAGQLIGHVVIGRDMVREAARRVEGFPEETLLLLEHAILAHHGRMDWAAAGGPQDDRGPARLARRRPRRQDQRRGPRRLLSRTEGPFTDPVKPLEGRSLYKGIPVESAPVDGTGFAD